MHNRARMRRALLLATLLAAPALAGAQTTPTPNPGVITFTGTDADLAASFINLAECSGPTRVKTSWTMTPESGKTPPTTGISYTLYASNKDSTAGTSCPATPPDAATTIVAVATIINQSTQSLIDQEFSTSTIASALGTGACSLAAEAPVFLCVQGSGADGTFGTARGKMTFSPLRPGAAPDLTTPVGPGNQALNVKWTDPASPTASKYEVRVVSMLDPSTVPTAGMLDPAGAFTAFDPRDTSRHSSGYVTATERRLGGLQNGVVYAVGVIAYSQAGNPSDPSDLGTATPQPVSDFWQVYKDAGGQEVGGCSSGLAGPIGLGLLAATLALVRRRK